MARSKSSSAWLKRHVSDPYVHRARAEGYRSRSAYKLIEIAKRDSLARPGDHVVDLGAAPGGWAQALAERVGRSGRVVAVDLLEIAPIPGVSVVRGDFREETVLQRLEDALDGRKLDLVVSDMAPNLSGVRFWSKYFKGQVIPSFSRRCARSSSPLLPENPEPRAATPRRCIWWERD